MQVGNADPLWELQAEPPIAAAMLLTDAAERLERNATRCAAGAASIADHLPAVLAASDPRAEEDVESLRSEIECLHGETAALEKRKARLEGLGLTPDMPADERQRRLQSEVDGLDEVSAELRGLLSLYAGALGGGQNGAQEARPRAAAAAGPGEIDAVLGALLAMERRLANLQRQGAGGARRWLALEEEVGRLREEGTAQQERLQQLRQEHADASREAERRVSALRQDVLEVRKAPSLSEAGSRAAAVLLRQLAALEDEAPRLGERADAAAAEAARAQKHCEEEESRAEAAMQLHADAEEAADAEMELRHSGAKPRLAALGRVSSLLKARLELSERRRYEAEGRLAVAGGEADGDGAL